MLLPQQVIPGLNSRDAHVREAACRYLESSSPKLLTADLCWALLDGSLPRPELNGWNILNGPQSAHSISRTLKAISSGQLFRDGPLDTAELVARLPLDVLEANRPQLDAHPAVSPKLRKQINRRIDRARAFEARPWERLEALATQNQDRSYSEMPDEVADLIHQIARHRPRAAAEAIERLNGPADSWVPIYAIDVLGRTRDEVAIEPLTKIAIDDFPTEDDATWEQVFVALSDIGTPAAIDALERLHHAGRPFQVNSALDALARIKRPDSEQALIRLADSAEDDMEATSLVIALAEIAATEPAAWAFVQGVVESRWDDLADDRYGLVLGFAPLVGWDAPELPAWRELHAAGAGRRKGLDKYRELFDRPAPPPNLPPPNDGQFVHVHAKVGRNDPCPCGSGKKYKKCCGV